MSTIPHDIIDHLVGIDANDALSQIRQLRSTAREQAQQSFVNLFDASAAQDSQFTQEERLLVAVFVATLNQQQDIGDFYAGLLDGRAVDLLKVVKEEAKQFLTKGPYGSFPKGTLSQEDQAGLQYVPSEAVKKALGNRLAAALQHTHLLVFHLRDASPAALQHLIDAGWKTADIVTLSQLVSFLSFQIRVVVGLRVLVNASSTAAAH